MFSKRTSTAVAPAAAPPPLAASGPDRSSTASTTTTSRSSIFSTFSAISAISAFSNKPNTTATKSPETEQQEEEEFNPVDITPPIAPGPTVTDASVFFPRNPNSKHLAHLTALNSSTPSASTAPSTNPSTAASTSTSPAPSIRTSVQTPTTSAPGATRTTLNLPPLTLPNPSTPTTPTPLSAYGPISPTPSTMSHFSFSYPSSFHGSTIGINSLPNIPQATVTRLVQTYFTIQALKVVGYQAAVAGRCAGIVHRVPFAFGGMEEAEEDDWELGGGDLIGDSGVDLVVSQLEEVDGGTKEPVEQVLASQFPQWFYLEDRQELLVSDNASILSGEAGVSGHRRSRSHPNPGGISIPGAAPPPSTAGDTRSRSGTTTTITPPPPQRQLFFHDPSNLLNASFAAFSFSSPNSASGATPPIDFSSVISFAADHPPPPVSPTGGETTTSSAAGSEAGDDVAQAVTLRTPLPIHLHHLHPKPSPTHQKHPYTWLPPLSRTTLSTPNPTIEVELGGIPHPIPIPTLPLVTLLVTSLLTAHGLLRSLTMGDRKVGNIALWQAVKLASFVRKRGGVGSASEGGGVVSLPGGVPKDALGVLARLRGEKGNEERRVILWALRSGVVATDLPCTPGGTPVQVHANGKFQHPGGLKRTYTAGANNHLRELVLVSRREGEGWRRSAPAAVMDYRVSSGAATPSIRSFSGVSVTSVGPGRNSMGYVEEEQVGEDGEVRVPAKRVSLDSQVGEMAELRREMGGSEGGEAAVDKELLSPVEPTGLKRGASLRWSFKSWGGGSK